MKSRFSRFFGLSLCIALIFSFIAIHHPTAAQDTLDTQAYEVRWMGQWISVPTNDGLYLFDSENLEADPLHYFTGKRITVSAADPVRNRMAVFDEAEFTLLIFEPTTGDIITEIPTDFDTFGLDDIEPEVARDLRYSDDGRSLAVLFSSAVIIYDAATSNERAVFPSFVDSDLNMTIDEGSEPDTFITGDEYGDMVTLTLDEDTPNELFATGGDRIYRLELLPGTTQVIYQHENKLKHTDLETDENGYAVLDETLFEDVVGFDLNNAGDTLAVAKMYQWLIYDLKTNTILLGTPTVESEFIFSLAFNEDGSQLVTLNGEGRLQLWDVATGEPLSDIYQFDYASSVWAG